MQALAVYVHPLPMFREVFTCHLTGDQRTGQSHHRFTKWYDTSDTPAGTSLGTDMRGSPAAVDGNLVQSRADARYSAKSAQYSPPFVQTYTHCWGACGHFKCACRNSADLVSILQSTREYGKCMCFTQFYDSVKPIVIPQNPDIVQAFFTCQESVSRILQWWLRILLMDLQIAQHFIPVFYQLPPELFNSCIQCAISALSMQERYSLVYSCNFLVHLSSIHPSARSLTIIGIRLS